MKRPENNEWLDKVLSETIGSKKPRADFEHFKRKHPDAVEMLTSRAGANSASRDPLTIRNIIMKSPFTKIAAAAVLIIAAFVGVRHFGGSIDGTTVAFAQITENMNKMPWMHTVVEGAGERLEVWYSYEFSIKVSKHANGEIKYKDFRKRVLQVYDPETSTVTFSHMMPDAQAGMGDSALDFPKLAIKLFEDAGEKVVQETGKYKGRDVKIFKMSGFLGGMDMKVEMTVDAEKNILLFLNQKAEKAGKLAMEANGYFDYPENGPESIYDVGIPKSAKIVRSEKEEEKKAYDKAFEEAILVIDAREDWPEPHDLVMKYWQARNAKNYDDLAVFWPGSATWNRQALEKEEPIEYVFDEAQSTETQGHIIVPYSTKNYFGKNGKYSLKMRLSNEKSSKGRYYIISGN